jgi:hypothetical protein
LAEDTRNFPRKANLFSIILLIGKPGLPSFELLHVLNTCFFLLNGKSYSVVRVRMKNQFFRSYSTNTPQTAPAGKRKTNFLGSFLIVNKDHLLIYRQRGCGLFLVRDDDIDIYSIKNHVNIMICLDRFLVSSIEKQKLFSSCPFCFHSYAAKAKLTVLFICFVMLQIYACIEMECIVILT